MIGTGECWKISWGLFGKAECGRVSVKRPKAVDEIAGQLGLNAIVFILGGLLFLYWGYSSQSHSQGGFLFAGYCLLSLGVPLGILTVGYYKLWAWTYPIVKLLISSPFGLKGDRMYFKKKITQPEVMRAFGLTPNSKDDQSQKNE